MSDGSLEWDPDRLSKTETQLVERIRSYGFHSFLSAEESENRKAPDPDSDPNGDRTIRAKLLRRMLFGLEVLREDNTIDTTSARSRGPRVNLPVAMEIRGAIIKGELDLEDVKGRDHAFAPHIALEYCTFVACEEDADSEERAGRIDVSDGVLSRFSLKGSRFRELDGRGAQFHGIVDLSQCESSEDPENPTGCADENGDQQPICWVNFRGATLHVEFRAAKAMLCAPKRDDGHEGSPRTDAMALEMRACKVRGNLMMTPDFVAVGGVSLINADCAGDIWLTGAKLVAKKRRAINLQYATVRGAVALDSTFTESGDQKRFRSFGAIRCYGAAIEGELWLAGAQVEPSRADGDDAENEPLLNCFMAHIGKQVRVLSKRNDKDRNEIIPVEIDGRLNFSNGVLGGLMIDMSAQSSEEREGKAHCMLEMKSMTSRSSVSIQGRFFRIWFQNARVDGALEFNKIEGPVQLFLENARVDGDLEFTDVGEAVLFDLENIRVGGDIELVNVVCQTMQLPNAQIDANLSVARGSEVGRIELPNAEIGGNFELKNSRLAWRRKLQSGKPQSVFAPNIEVRGRVEIDALSEASLSLPTAHINGELFVKNLEFHNIDNAKLHRLDLQGARIDGGVIFENLSRYVFVEDIQPVKQAELRFYPSGPGQNWRLVEVFDDGAKKRGDDRNIPNDAVRPPLRSYLWDGRHEVVELPGVSPPIHSFNERNRPKLDENTAPDYLDFFCAHIWGEDGAFRLVRDKEELVSAFESPEKLTDLASERGVNGFGDELALKASKEIEPDTVTASSGDDDIQTVASKASDPAEANTVWVIDAIVHYSDALFRAKFRVLPTGMVEMVEDDLLRSDYPPIYVYKPPHRYLKRGKTQKERALSSPAIHWSDLNETDKDQFVAALRGDGSGDPSKRAGAKTDDGLLRRVSWMPSSPSSNAAKAKKPSAVVDPPFVNLAGVRTASFDDYGGTAWKGNVQLRLENFVYEQIYDKKSHIEQSGDDPLLQPSPQQDKRMAKSLSVGFANARQSKPERGDERAEMRIKWFCRQYEGGTLDGEPAELEDFQAQPYEHLAQLYRQSGRQIEAATILERRLELENWVRNTWWPNRNNMSRTSLGGMIALALAAGLIGGVEGLSIVESVSLVAATFLVLVFGWPAITRMYGFFFGYGMRPLRAFMTFIACLGVGWLAADFATDGRYTIQRGWVTSALAPAISIDAEEDWVPISVSDAYMPILEIDSEPAAIVAPTGPEEEEAAPMNLDIPREAIPCGDEISPGLYAIDVFIPLLDLRQEVRCAPSTEDHVAAKIARWFKAFYAVLGWVVTTLLLLTVAGFIKRRIED